MRNFVDLKKCLRPIYTWIIINTVFPLLNKDSIELLGCLNELRKSNIQCV